MDIIIVISYNSFSNHCNVIHLWSMSIWLSTNRWTVNNRATVDADTCVADDEKDPDYVPDNSSGNDSDTTVASAQPPLTKKRWQFNTLSARTHGVDDLPQCHGPWGWRLTPVPGPMGLTTYPSATAHGVDIHHLPHGVALPLVDSVNRMGTKIRQPHGCEPLLVMCVNPMGEFVVSTPRVQYLLIIYVNPMRITISSTPWGNKS